MKRLFAMGILALACSQMAHAADVVGDSIRVTFNNGAPTDIRYDAGVKPIDAQGVYFGDADDPYNAYTALYVTGTEITITSRFGRDPEYGAYDGITFANMSKNFPGTYALISSTFIDLPSGSFYSTAGNLFSVNLAEGHAGQGGTLVFALPSPVPEPESYAMLLAGMGLMGVVAKRRQRRPAMTA